MSSTGSGHSAVVQATQAATIHTEQKATQNSTDPSPADSEIKVIAKQPLKDVLQQLEKLRLDYSAMIKIENIMWVLDIVKRYINNEFLCDNADEVQTAYNALRILIQRIWQYPSYAILLEMKLNFVKLILLHNLKILFFNSNPPQDANNNDSAVLYRAVLAATNFTGIQQAWNNDKKDFLVWQKKYLEDLFGAAADSVRFDKPFTPNHTAEFAAIFTAENSANASSTSENHTTASIDETPSSADLTPTGESATESKQEPVLQQLTRAATQAEIETVRTLLNSKELLESKGNTDAVLQSAIETWEYLCTLENSFKKKLSSYAPITIQQSTTATWDFTRIPNDTRSIKSSQALLTVLQTGKTVTVNADDSHEFNHVFQRLKTRFELVIATLLERRDSLSQSVFDDVFLKFRNNHHVEGLDTWTPLHFAAAAGDVAKVRALITSVDINATDSTGRTALALAAKNGHADVVQALLTAKANPELTYSFAMRAEGPYIRSEYGTRDITPLMSAAQYGHVIVVNLLLEAKADPDKRDYPLDSHNIHKSALHYAVCGPADEAINLAQRQPIITTLLGPKPDRQSSRSKEQQNNTLVQKQTPSRKMIYYAILLAIRSGQKDLVLLLIEYAVPQSLDMQYKHHGSILHAVMQSSFVNEQERLALLRKLRNYQINLNCVEGGLTAVANAQSPEIVQWFIDNHADLLYRSKDYSDDDRDIDVLGRFVRDAVSMRFSEINFAKIQVVLAHFIRRRRKTSHTDKLLAIQTSLNQALEIALDRVKKSSVEPIITYGRRITQLLLAAGADIHLILESACDNLSFGMFAHVLRHACVPTAIKSGIIIKCFNKICERFHDEQNKSVNTADFMTIFAWFVGSGIKPDQCPSNVRNMEIAHGLTLWQHLKNIEHANQAEEKQITARKAKLEDLVKQLSPNALTVVSRSALTTSVQSESSEVTSSAASSEHKRDTTTPMCASATTIVARLTPSTSSVESKQDRDAKESTTSHPMPRTNSTVTNCFENMWDYMFERNCGAKDNDLVHRNIYIGLFLEALKNGGTLPNSQIDVIDILELAQKNASLSRNKTFATHCKAFLMLYSPMHDNGHFASVSGKIPHETRCMQKQRLVLEYQAFLANNNIKSTPLYKILQDCVANYVNVIKMHPRPLQQAVGSRTSVSAKSTESVIVVDALQRSNTIN